MVEMQNQVQSHRWWFESHSFPRRSPWLQSTLSELDEKTAAMLKLIEEDADSFAQRAEMYYKKRPELISMVENFYRAHRSLAERYDLLKSDTPRVLSNLASPFSFKKSHSNKAMSMTDQTYSTYSDNSDVEELAESVVEDPEQEYEIQVEEDEDTDKDQTSDVLSVESKTRAEKPASGEEVMKLRAEIERLRGQNRSQKEQLMQKDEEKREVIRQLSFAVGALKDENLRLRRNIAAATSSGKKWARFEFINLREGFLGKLFNIPGKTQTSIVAL